MATQKRKRTRLFYLLLFILLLGFSIHAYKSSINPARDVKAAFLLDADTGKVYYQYNADSPLPPASMTKMMTELVVLTSLENDLARWDEPVTVSPKASEADGSNIGLQAGEQVRLGDLFEAMVIYSANDAAIALAEHIAGTEEQFVQLMNEQAAAIGLSSETQFANTTGLPSQTVGFFHSSESGKETVMTAKDAGILASYLIQHFPHILEVTSQVQYFDKRTGNVYYNTNLMLPDRYPKLTYPGTVGFKTGFTDEAGYCFTGMAVKGDKRLIAVVMGTSSNEQRFIEASNLFDYGFNE